MNLKLLSLCVALVLASRTVKSSSLVSEENLKWNEWKSLHRKSYTDSYEENFRYAIWRYNMKKIEDHSKADRGFTIGLNKWSDMTPNEFQYLMQRKRLGRVQHNRTSSRIDTLPKQVDWRKRGCVTPVQDQGEITKSWPFSAVGSLEGRHCIVKKQLKSLDVKKLDNCCTSCESVVDGFQYMIAHNHVKHLRVSTPSGNENCNFSTASYGASLTGFDVIPRGNESLLQRAVAFVGPVSVTIDAGLPSFQMYVDGVYDEPSCSSIQLDHAVLVVGYGTWNGKDYWLVKNSWGVNWGMEGYIMMARNKNNQCGIATEAVYPTGVTVEHFSRF